jgi:hypothetical protein
MSGEKADIFVEIKGDDAREVEGFFAVHADEFAVHSFLRVTGGQAEAEIWFLADRIGDHARRFAAQFGVVVGDEDEHGERQRNLRMLCATATDKLSSRAHARPRRVPRRF